MVTRDPQRAADVEHYLTTLVDERIEDVASQVISYIAAHDSGTQRLFVVSANAGAPDVLEEVGGVVASNVTNPEERELSAGAAGDLRRRGWRSSRRRTARSTTRCGRRGRDGRPRSELTGGANR